MYELRTIGSPRAVQREIDHPHENTSYRYRAPVPRMLNEQRAGVCQGLAARNTRSNARPLAYQGSRRKNCSQQPNHSSAGRWHPCGVTLKPHALLIGVRNLNATRPRYLRKDHVGATAKSKEHS